LKSSGIISFPNFSFYLVRATKNVLFLLQILNMELVNREISWLSFNARVLQESLDPKVPLVERVRFLGIYSNNMDEFFRVRVANIRRIISIRNNSVQGFAGTAQELLEEIRTIVMEQQKQFEACYASLVEDLAAEKIFQLQEKNLNKVEQTELNNYFHHDLKHAIVPIILDVQTPFPKLRDKSIYLAVRIQTAVKHKVLFSLIEIPPNYPRFYRIENEGSHYFILIDDIIRLNLESIYSIFEFESVEAYTFKFTRDAELNLDDDLSVSFIEKIEKSIKLRKKGEPVRFVFDQKMPTDLKNYLLKSMNLKSGTNAIPGGRYHNFKDFSRFPDFGKKELVYEQMPALAHPTLEHTKSYLKSVLEKDILLHFPYQRFDHVVDMLREAAIDPKVKSIKINVYRVASDSQIMNALLNAVSNGKEVVVILELQARFDEENNLYWAERLKEHGARVIYGVQGLKVHSKLIQITRQSKGKEQLISFIGTGNFHEKTARVYSDLGLITAHPDICQEVRKIFRLLENNIDRGLYRHLLVSPFNNRRKITALIQHEITHAQKGHPAAISIKINNLVDAKIIEKLYQASQAGVKVRMIIRGICCLVPGIKKVSDNIEVVSIVDRFLEHARFMIFENNGHPKYIMTSADLMERNLDKRIEVGTPILDPDIQQEFRTIFDIQWKDNQKTRIIDKKQRNKYRKTIDGDDPVRAQTALYEYYRDKLK
jgi:polyphosphate kinase